MYFCLMLLNPKVSATGFLPQNFLCSFVCVNTISDGCCCGAAEIKTRDTNIAACLLFIQVSRKSKYYVCSNSDGDEVENEQNDGYLQVCIAGPRKDYI